MCEDFIDASFCFSTTTQNNRSIFLSKQIKLHLSLMFCFILISKETKKCRNCYEGICEKFRVGSCDDLLERGLLGSFWEGDFCKDLFKTSADTSVKIFIYVSVDLRGYFCKDLCWSFCGDLNLCVDFYRGFCGKIVCV